MTVCELATRYGTMFVPDTDRGQYWWLANTGISPEDEFIEDICGLLDERPKGVAVDVGANFGCWTLPLSQHAHRVIAIEPQRCCRDLLIRSLKANRISNVDIMAVAAGKEVGSTTIPALDIDSDTNFGGISVGRAHHEQPDAPMAVVQVSRVDDLVHGAPVSFIKIDVEGFEHKVLAGARGIIARCKPILFVEMDHAMTDRDMLKKQIEDMGYLTTPVGGNYVGMPYE
jgi:FkbM family methyltransferase